MVRSPGRADPWLMSYHSFSPDECYRHATASSLTLFDSPRPADSNGLLPESIRPLAVELDSSLSFRSPGRYLEIAFCRELQVSHQFEPYSPLFVLFPGF